LRDDHHHDSPNDRWCPDSQAISGISTDIENYSDVIKTFNIHCSEVPSPSNKCIPTDKKILLISCDNSRYSTVMHCKYTSKEGVNTHKAESQSERNEKSFSEEFEWGIGTTVSVNVLFFSAELQTNFRNNLGTSTTTGVNYEQTTSSTFLKETTHEVDFTVLPGKKGSLFQNIGKCSFFEISHEAYFLEDVNVTTTY